MLTARQLLFPVPEDLNLKQVRVKGLREGGPTPFTKPKKRGRVKALISRRERRRRRLLKEREVRETSLPPATPQLLTLSIQLSLRLASLVAGEGGRGVGGGGQGTARRGQVRVAELQVESGR